jgi:hypothetical protein
MKKIILLICLIAFNSTLFSQILLVGSNVNPMLVNENSLFNVILQSNYQKSFSASIEVNITDFNNNNVITVLSSKFNMEPGANLLNDKNLNARKTSWGNNEVAKFTEINSYLLAGKYQICFHLIPHAYLEGPETFCDEIESSVISYLNLVFPADKDSIEMTRPVLYWNHSEGVTVNNAKEFYRIVVAEQKKGETPEQALLKNLPVFQRDFLSTHEVNYPSEIDELERGKTYAWHVLKLANTAVINKSEAWQFTVKEIKIPNSIEFIMLAKNSEKNVYTIEDGLLNIRIDEPSINRMMNYIIIDKTNKTVYDSQKNKASITIKSGYNEVKIDLNKIHLKDGAYIFETVNSQNEKQRFYFTLK